MQATLNGLRIVEFAGIGPGPFCGMMFADMGADVILIERASPNANAVSDGVVSGARAKSITDRGKRSIALDLKRPEDIEIALKIVETSDALIEGFRPGVMEKLGLGPEECLKRNERLIYGRMTGWGQTGPLAHSAGHDPNYLGVSGSLWAGGRKGRAPISPLTLAGDVGGGSMILAWGIMCALREVARTGKGTTIDAAITDGSAYLSTLLWMMQGIGEDGTRPGDTWVDGAAPWHETYECLDGAFVTVCAIEPKFYKLFIQLIGLENEPSLQDQWDSKSWAQAREIVAGVFATKTQAEWDALLGGTDACCAPVLPMRSAPGHPHNAARGTFGEIGGVVQPMPAPIMGGARAKPRAVPSLSEHRETILSELGIPS